MLERIGLVRKNMLALVPWPFGDTDPCPYVCWIVLYSLLHVRLGRMETERGREVYGEEDKTSLVLDDLILLSTAPTDWTNCSGRAQGATARNGGWAPQDGGAVGATTDQWFPPRQPEVEVVCEGRTEVPLGTSIGSRSSPMPVEPQDQRPDAWLASCKVGKRLLRSR